MLKLLFGTRRKRTVWDWVLDVVIIVGVAALAWWRWTPPL